ncbi:MAG: alkaline phosphatase family protein [Anaerolineae bacterium]|nr:alkaline phosphatase family protein [Anaerolineae bacterium]
MKRFSSIGLSILVLVGVMVGMTLWLRAFRTSLQDYRSPLSQIDLTPAVSPATKTTKVVLVLIGGLGYDASLALDLPVFEQLKRVGANAAVESVPPTYSQTAWATLISGAPPETNDAPPIDIAFEDLRLLDVDTIFARTHQANRRTALLGLADWRRLIPRNYLDYIFFVDTPGPESDQLILENALALINDDVADFVLIHFTQVDDAAQLQGGLAGQAYQDAVRQVDAYLGQISSALDLNRTVLIILADHGHIAAGGHGGAEPDVTWQPLVMVGANTIPGNYSDVHQTDLAPTVATLLGVASPGAAQGRILFEMFRLDKSEQTVTQLQLAQQRIRLAEAYLTALARNSTISPDALTGDLSQAQAAFVDNNVDGAFQLASLAQQQADARMKAARISRMQAEKWPRLAVAALIVLMWLNTMRRRQGFHAGSILIATVVAVALYHGLYQLQGYSFSLSSIPGEYAEFFFDVARRVAVSLLAGGGLLLVFLMLTDEIDWIVLLGTGYGFSVVITFIFILPFFWAYWQNGLVVTWHLPAVGPAFWQVSSASEAISTAALGLILPWPIMSLSLFINLIRRRLSEPQTRPSEPGPLRGLR